MIEKEWRGAPQGSFWVPPGPRPIRGICLHHSAGRGYVTPRAGASWHFWVDQFVQPNGLCAVYANVDEMHCAHGVGQTDVWRPSWVPKRSPGPVSPINYVALHIEIQFAPQSPYFDFPSPPQCRTVKALLQDIYARLGPLPVVGHGQVDSSKWPTEPHGLDWEACGLTAQDAHGRWLAPAALPPPEEEDGDVIQISDADLKAYLESYGVGVNLDTALIKRAALAYRRGETRGPAITGEYDYNGRARQRFTAAIAEYQPETGEVHWVELNVHPEE